MSSSEKPAEETLAPATVLGWVVPGPTGRWHQAIVVTHNEVWITPEITFAENQAMEEAASESIVAFRTFVSDAGWLNAQRCAVTDVKGLNWDNITGWMRILAANDKVIGAMIPNRGNGDELEPKIKEAISLARRKVNVETTEK